MKLLLRRDIAKVGLAGDIIDVSEGYARNYLIPNHLAVEPTKANMKRIEEDKRLAEEERRQRRVAIEEMAGRMSNVEVTIAAACNREGHLYGSVGPREIAAALRDEGHVVDAKQVQLREPLRQLDTVVVPVVLADDIKVDVKVWIVRETGSIVEEEEEQDRRRSEKSGREARPYDQGTGVDALDLDL